MTTHQQPGLRTSSADPFVLSTYVTNATAMTATLPEKVTALTAATEALTAAGETIPGLADFVDRPRDHSWTEDGIGSWVDEQMTGTAVVVHTAMDTRRATATRTDPDNAGLADTDRLADDWAEGFETYDGDAQLDYSLLVVEADLAADVLVAVGDDHLGDHFGYDDRGAPGRSGLDSAGPPTTEADLNIAAAIAANPDASLAWLTGDGIAPGTDNVELVLTTPDIAPDMYTALAEVVDTGLTHPTDPAGRGGLMEHTIRIVADDLAGADLDDPPSGTTPEDAELATDAMRQAFGNGAAANMNVLHAMITDDWGHAVSGEPPSDDALATHDFLRETMADEVAADRVAAGYVTYAVEQLGPDVLPEPGVDSSPGDLLDDRREMLQQIGTLEGTIVRAENNALIGSVEERIAAQRARGRSVNAGIDIAAFFAGTAPGYGLVVGGVDTTADVAGVSVGDLVFPIDESALDAAEEEATASERRSAVNFATLNALANGAEQPPIDPTDGVNDEERLAYEAWLIENHYDGFAHDAMVAGFGHAREFENRR